jgi:hypothetical protein
MNGDWSGINISNSDDSEFEYIILEFSGMGIEQYYSNVYIANSIIRWVNIEGVYSEHSTSTFENNTFYSNGYHEIALEQFNTDMVIQNNIFEDGHEGIAIFDTSATVTGNYFTDYEGSAIVVAGSTDATITQNKFNNITAEEISQPGGDEVTVEENDFGDDSIEIPMMDYDIITNHTLSYIPASTDDQFPYVYDTEDETREVTKRIGAGLGFGWTLTYADGYLYKMDGGTIYKIDPDTEDYDTITTTDPLLTASSALTYDGTHFWIVNTSLNKIVEFSITGNTATVESSFDAGSTAVRIAGLTTDGTYLYYVSSNKMTKLEKSGNVVTETSFDPGTAADGLIVWTGQDFWGSGGYKGLIRFDATGKVLGTVYPPAFGMTEVAWDGQNLWVLAKTCERWNDAKIFKLKILDDSVPGD